MTLLIGIPACTRAIRGHPQHATPSRYGAEEDETPGLHDPARDATTLPLIREALRRGMPLLAVCRGIQEVNVALGGSLHQRVHLLPGRLDHRGGPGPHSRAYAMLRTPTASPFPRFWRRLPRLCRRDGEGGLSLGAGKEAFSHGSAPGGQARLVTGGSKGTSYSTWSLAARVWRGSFAYRPFRATQRSHRMNQVLYHLTLPTTGQGLFDVTKPVCAWVKEQGISTGLLTIWCRHTSASLLVQANADPEVQADMEAFFVASRRRVAACTGTRRKA